MGNRFREKVTEEGLEAEVEDRATEATDTEGASTTEEGRTSSRSNRAASGLAKALGGDILSDRLVLRQIPLLLLCLFYLLLLVANRYKVEGLSRDKMATQERIDELRERRIQTQKQYQKSVRISQIAEALRESGVGITSGPPYEIEK